MNCLIGEWGRDSERTAGKASEGGGKWCRCEYRGQISVLLFNYVLLCTKQHYFTLFSSISWSELKCSVSYCRWHWVDCVNKTKYCKSLSSDSVDLRMIRWGKFDFYFDLVVWVSVLISLFFLSRTSLSLFWMCPTSRWSSTGISRLTLRRSPTSSDFFKRTWCIFELTFLECRRWVYYVM